MLSRLYRVLSFGQYLLERISLIQRQHCAYIPLSVSGIMISKDEIEDFSIPPFEKTSYPRKRWRSHSVFAICFLISSGVALYFFFYHSFNAGTAPNHIHHGDACTEDRVLTRREWRHLTIHEQETYLEAVQCLQRTPGKVSKEQSLFGDFAFHHSRIGNICEYIIRTGTKARL